MFHKTASPTLVDLHYGGQILPALWGPWPGRIFHDFFSQSYNFLQSVNKCNAFKNNKAFEHPILGLYEVPWTVFALGPLVV